MQSKRNFEENVLNAFWKNANLPRVCDFYRLPRDVNVLLVNELRGILHNFSLQCWPLFAFVTFMDIPTYEYRPIVCVFVCTTRIRWRVFLYRRALNNSGMSLKSMHPEISTAKEKASTSWCLHPPRFLSSAFTKRDSVYKI